MLAVKVADDPAQIEVDGVEITMVGTTLFTVIVIVLLFATVGEAHNALLVSVHRTVLPLVRLEELKFGLFVPTFTPLTLHW